MEFIDKTKSAREAEDIINSFLKSFIDEEANYPEDLYDAFCRDRNTNGKKYRELLTNILKLEQKNRCCYCMQRLVGETVEHIIPNKINTKIEFENYLCPNTVLNKYKLYFTKEFLCNRETNFPPYPHTIAYQNLTLSCCSNNHCNNFRGDKTIKPLIFYSTISEDIEYKFNGFVVWKNETEDLPTLVKLGLNDDSLMMIRRIWLFANNENVNLLYLDKNKRHEFILRLLPEVEKNEEDILLKFKNDKQWELLKRYDYFASYKLKSIAKQLSNLTAKELKDLIEQIVKSIANK